jgi:hypothetical protein
MDKKMLIRDEIMFNLGAVHLVIFMLLCIYFPFNDKVVLGLNSALKPMKFALSIWIYSWTMALLLPYFNDQEKVKTYTWVAVICMGFEQIAITSQAFRGQLSHFNRTDIYGMILFSLMGVFILTVTLWTGYIIYIFFKQKTYNLRPEMVLAIKFGLNYFVIFSLFGGYISSLQGHTIGAKDGGEGILFLNWSKFFGDLRVSHFFGIHSLQMIPLFAIISGKYFDTTQSVKVTTLFALIYLGFIIFTLVQGLIGLPLFHLWRVFSP